MDCIGCNTTGAGYRLVGAETHAVCEQCVAEHLTGGADEDACLYCDRTGDYDLAEDTGAVAGPDAAGDYEVVTRGVVCGDHASKVGRENR